MEDDGVRTFYHTCHQVLRNHVQVRTHAMQMLNRKDQGLKDIVHTLQIHYDNMEEPASRDADSPSQKDILSELIKSLNT
jgi:beta-catenin-like protein 1